jgi:hypothetical protein
VEPDGSVTAAVPATGGQEPCKNNAYGAPGEIVFLIFTRHDAPALPSAKRAHKHAKRKADKLPSIQSSKFTQRVCCFFICTGSITTRANKAYNPPPLEH